MTGVNGPISKLLGWCGTNHFLLSACELGIGVLPAFVFGLAFFTLAKRVATDRLDSLSNWQFALLFACVAWGFFAFIIAARLDAAVMLIPVALVSQLFFAPISIIVGIPALLFYLIWRPVLNVWAVYLLSASILALSYLYLVHLDQAFGSS